MAHPASSSLLPLAVSRRQQRRRAELLDVRTLRPPPLPSPLPTSGGNHPSLLCDRVIYVMCVIPDTRWWSVGQYASSLPQVACVYVRRAAYQSNWPCTLQQTARSCAHLCNATQCTKPRQALTQPLHPWRPQVTTKHQSVEQHDTTSHSAQPAPALAKLGASDQQRARFPSQGMNAYSRC